MQNLVKPSLVVQLGAITEPHLSFCDSPHPAGSIPKSQARTKSFNTLQNRTFESLRNPTRAELREYPSE